MNQSEPFINFFDAVQGKGVTCNGNVITRCLQFNIPEQTFWLESTVREFQDDACWDIHGKPSPLNLPEYQYLLENFKG